MNNKNGQTHNVHNDDLIELKKIKQGLVDAPTAVQHTEKVKLTGWPAVANFLRYNGLPILIGILIIAAIGYYIFDRIQQKTPDCLIVANTGALSLQGVAENYAEIFTAHCPDSNDDGVALASVIDCSYDESTTNAQELSARILKFQAQFSIEYAQLFILNYDNMVNLENESDGDLWVDDLQLKEYNGKAVKLNGTEFEEIYKQETGFGFPEDIYLCMRKTGDAIAESKSGKASIKAARQILTELNEQSQN